jgi:transposase
LLKESVSKAEGSPSIEERIPADHPLRAMRRLVDPVLVELSPRFQRLYAPTGRPSIPPEQLDYNLLYRWFVGLTPDDPVWVPTVFTENRDRLLGGRIAEAFFQQVRGLADRHQVLSAEHFTVDGTLLEAWASHKSFQPVAAPPPPSDDDPSNPSGNGCAGARLSCRARGGAGDVAAAAAARPRADGGSRQGL